MSKLKPCPFCGGDAYIYELKCGWYVDCTNDDNCSHSPSQQNGIHIKQDAINNWNTRAPQSEWISVTDNLPVQSQSNRYLSLNLVLAGRTVVQGGFDDGLFWLDGVRIDNVTHWQPLPSLPN